MMSNRRWETEVGRSGGWVIGTIVVDQLAKFFVRRSNFPFVENSSLPFGVNLPGVLNFWAVAAALLAFVFLSVKYLPKSCKTVGWNLIVGGAVSNLLDRAGDGRVTDFINIKISILNIADLAIFLGLAIYAAKNLFRRGSGTDGGARPN